MMKLFVPKPQIKIKVKEVHTLQSVDRPKVLYVGIDAEEEGNGVYEDMMLTFTHAQIKEMYDYLNNHGLFGKRKKPLFTPLK